MILDKRGISTGFSWVFGLVSMFGIGVIYIVFSQVFKAHLVPTITNYVNGSASIPAETKVEIIGNIAKYMSFWDIIPFILVLVIVIYMIIVSIRKEGETTGF